MKQRADENERKVRYLEVKVRQLEQELYQYRQSGPAGQHDVLMEENQILRQNVHILEQEVGDVVCESERKFIGTDRANDNLCMPAL